MRWLRRYFCNHQWDDPICIGSIFDEDRSANIGIMMQRTCIKCMKNKQEGLTILPHKSHNLTLVKS